MKFLKTINAVYGLILGLGAFSMVLTGRIFEGGLFGTLGGLLGIAIFAPPFGLAFYALRDQQPAGIRMAFRWNIAVLVTLVVIDAIFFIGDPGSVANPVALLAFQLFVLALPAALNVAVLRSLGRAQAGAVQPRP